MCRLQRNPIVFVHFTCLSASHLESHCAHAAQRERKLKEIRGFPDRELDHNNIGCLFNKINTCSSCECPQNQHKTLKASDFSKLGYLNTEPRIMVLGKTPEKQKFFFLSVAQL